MRVCLEKISAVVCGKMQMSPRNYLIDAFNLHLHEETVIKTSQASFL